MKRLAHIVAMVFVLTPLCLLSATARAYDVKGFEGKSARAGLKHFLPRSDAPENRRNKFYSEQYSFDSTPLEGGNFWFQIFISNMGVKNGRAAVLVHYTPKDGKRIKSRTVFNKGKWSYKEEGSKVVITLGKNTFQGDGNSWQAHFENDQFVADYRVQNSAPAWRPGGGAVYYGKGKKRYYDVTLLTPRGAFETDITLAGGEKHGIRGTAYGDHSIINLSPNLQARKWIRIRKVGKRQTILLTTLQTSEQYEGQWLGWFMVASDKGIKVTAVNPKIELSGLANDAENGYQVPTIVMFNGASGADNFQGVIKGHKRTGRKDKLRDLSTIERAVVSKIVQPVSYTYRSSFEFRYDKRGKPRTVKGKANYRFEQTTK
jgi:hypothetical protein